MRIAQVIRPVAIRAVVHRLLSMADLTRKAVLEQFDRLQKEGELFYAPTEPIREESHGMEVSTIIFFVLFLYLGTRVKIISKSIYIPKVELRMSATYL